MPIIIDGWNLIRNESSNIDDDSMESIEAVRLLVSHLEHFQKTHNDPILVIFDSSSEFLDLRRKDTEKLSVVPSKNADNYIKRYIDKTPIRQRRNIRVISSDNEVYYYAKSSYATPLKCEEFWDKLRNS